MPLSIDVAPVTEIVLAGAPAFFECAAEGTSVEIQWLYNGANYTGIPADRKIHSTRSFLELQSPSSNGSVAGSVICVVRQSFDGTISLNNDDFDNNLPEQSVNFTAELLLRLPQTTAMPATSTTTPATGII